jgi:hypothetical protein
MSGSCAQPAFGRLAIKTGESPYTWSGGTRLRYWRENVRYRGTWGHPNVIMGTLQEDSERVRRGPSLFAGVVTVPVNPAEMQILGPLFMGGSFAGTTCPYAETVPTFGMLVDKVTDVYEYPNGVVNRILIHGQQRGPEGPPNWITMAVEVLFKDEIDGQSFPDALALPKTADYTDFVFEDLTLTILGAARAPKEFSLLIHRHQRARYVNSIKPNRFCTSGLTVVLTARFPFDDDHLDLHDQPLAGASGSLALTNGTVSTTFNFANLQSPPLTPENPGNGQGDEEGEIDIVTTLVARKAGSTNAITLINDSTV